MRHFSSCWQKNDVQGEAGVGWERSFPKHIKMAPKAATSWDYSVAKNLESQLKVVWDNICAELSDVLYNQMSVAVKSRLISLF